MEYIFTTFLGVTLLVFAYTQYRKRLAFITTAGKTTATVEVHKTQGQDNTMLTPYFKFKTSSGKEIRYKSKFSASWVPWKNGDEVEVAYDTQNPEKVIILRYWGVFTPVVLLLIPGIILLIVAIGYFLSLPLW